MIDIEERYKIYNFLLLLKISRFDIIILKVVKYIKY